MVLPVDSAGDVLLALALTLPRIAAAFLMLPLLTTDNMPATVRNSFFVSMAIVALPVAAAASPTGELGGAAWGLIVLKEIFIGLAIGFSFGVVFWAIGAAGNIIDTKVGTTMASALDPIQGHQTSLTGLFLSELAAWLFMASGAFLLFLDLLLTSYAIWPVMSYVPQLDGGGVYWFVQQFGFLMTLMLVLSAPALVVLSLIDLGLGYMNRFAQQLNVFMLALSIKSWVAIWILLLMLGLIVELIVRTLVEHRSLLDVLERVI
ncbi:MAG: type III secretion system export apparatus subunit SctT [Lysobacteraceae bacterium]